MNVELKFGQHYDQVLVDGKPLEPARSQAIWNHSPSGFAWGYGGSGPAQLALALLLEAGATDEEAINYHQKFKDRFVARWPQMDGSYVVDAKEWLEEVRAADVSTPRPQLVVELFQGVAGQWYFHLKAANGETVAQSEGYADKRDAFKAIALIATHMVGAPVRELP